MRCWSTPASTSRPPFPPRAAPIPTTPTLSTAPVLRVGVVGIGAARGGNGGRDVDAGVDQQRIDRVDVGPQRGLEDVLAHERTGIDRAALIGPVAHGDGNRTLRLCLLYTSDAADDLLCVDLGGRRIIKKKKK